MRSFSGVSLKSGSAKLKQPFAMAQPDNESTLKRGGRAGINGFFIVRPTSQKLKILAKPNLRFLQAQK
jgi:hypothetical protein